MFLDKIFPSGGYQEMKTREEQTGKKLIEKNDKILRVLVTIFVLILPFILLVILYFKNKEIFFTLLPYYIAPLSVFLSNRLIEHRVINNTEIDLKIVLFSTFVLLLSFSTAKVNSDRILMNKEFQYIFKNETFYKYLGKAGDNYFLQTIDDSSISILKYDELKGNLFRRFNGDIRNENDSIINSEILKENTSNTKK